MLMKLTSIPNELFKMVCTSAALFIFVGLYQFISMIFDLF